MNFKIDENLPLEIAVLLLNAGYGAQTVINENLGGQPDAVIINHCQSEVRILVTLDVDFADIRLYHPGNYHGIIVLRLKRQDKLSVISAFEKLIPMFSNEQPDRQLWIVQEDKIRIRE